MSASVYGLPLECHGDDVISPNANEKDIYVQLVISMALGVTSFLAFCVSLGRPVLVHCSISLHATQFLRPRWKDLYAARKRQTDAAAALPDLPDNLFGWMTVLYRVTEEQVLASAGLDAFVVRAVADSG